MKKIVVFLILLFVLISCGNTRDKESQKTQEETKKIKIEITEQNKEKYYRIYEEIIRLTKKYKNNQEELKNKIDEVYENYDLTKKEFDQLGLKLIKEDKEDFKKRISEINQKFSSR